MATTDTLSLADEALPTQIEVSPEMMAVAHAFLDLVDCMERVEAIKDEIRRHPDYDRTSLDLAG